MGIEVGKNDGSLIGKGKNWIGKNYINKLYC